LSSSLLLPGGTSAPAERHRSVTILLAQSGDATCSGLTSPTEGSRTLKLTKGKSLHHNEMWTNHLTNYLKKKKKKEREE
jgi:hypothetical protein